MGWNGAPYFNGRSKKIGELGWNGEITTYLWQLKHFFGIFIPIPGEIFIQFDEHIFQMGWFNHQLVLLEDVGTKIEYRLQEKGGKRGSCFPKYCLKIQV